MALVLYTIPANRTRFPAGEKCPCFHLPCLRVAAHIATIFMPSGHDSLCWVEKVAKTWSAVCMCVEMHALQHAHIAKSFVHLHFNVSSSPNRTNLFGLGHSPLYLVQVFKKIDSKCEAVVRSLRSARRTWFHGHNHQVVAVSAKFWLIQFLVKPRIFLGSFFGWASLQRVTQQ